MDFENNIEINNGIYTIPEISKILRLPYQKVSYWINKYWDSELGKIFEGQYSWTINKSKAVSFHTLIEFFVFYQMGEAGVNSAAFPILLARGKQRDINQYRLYF